MHESGAQTRPAVAPDEIEWAFQQGQPAIVVHIPNGYGDWIVYRLDRAAPEQPYEREHVRALLRIAERVMSNTEPANPNGSAS